MHGRILGIGLVMARSGIVFTPTEELRSPSSVRDGLARTSPYRRLELFSRLWSK